MRLYLDAALEYGLAGKGYSQKEIATLANVSESQVSRWHQVPEFLDAVAGVFRKVQPIILEGTVVSLLRQAAKGNVLTFNAICDRLERWGRIAVVQPQASAPDGSPLAPMVQGVQVHIHQIPEPAPRSTLPPPLELPAQASAAKSTTPAK